MHHYQMGRGGDEWGKHIGPALMHSESAKKIGFIGLKWLGYYVEQGSALGFEVFQFFLIEILLQSWKK